VQRRLVDNEQEGESALNLLPGVAAVSSSGSGAEVGRSGAGSARRLGYAAGRRIFEPAELLSWFS
jgi:hypothetical protein